MSSRSLFKLFRSATRLGDSGRRSNLMTKLAGRRAAGLWLASLLALALIGAACSDSGPTPGPATAEATQQIRTLLPPVVPTATAIPTPIPTATLVPTPTPVPPTFTPTPVPRCVLNLVPPDIDSPDSTAEDEAWRFLEDLTMQLSPRESATDEEFRAGEELDCLLQEIGYETRFQEFDHLENTISSVGVDLEVLPEMHAILSLPIEDSAEGQATGELVYVGQALEGEIGDERLDGKIALIERGVDTFQDKTARVEAAGATAALIFNSSEGLFEGVMVDLDDLPSIPAVGISRADGLAMLEAVEDGGLEASVAVTKIYQPSRNLIAEIPGGPEGQGVVIVGAHYDTVHFTQGANDNGSGVTAVLAIANHIIENDYPFTVRLILFGSEEVGLVGSRHYVAQLTEEERADIIAMINFDVPGSGTNLEVWGDPGLTLAAVAVAAQSDILLSENLTRGSSRSDHRPFHDAGAPAIIVTANDISRINSPRDTLEFVDPQLVAWAAEVGVGLLDYLAQTHMSESSEIEATPVQ